MREIATRTQILPHLLSKAMARAVLVGTPMRGMDREETRRISSGVDRQREKNGFRPKCRRSCHKIGNPRRPANHIAKAGMQAEWIQRNRRVRSHLMIWVLLLRERVARVSDSVEPTGLSFVEVCTHICCSESRTMPWLYGARRLRLYVKIHGGVGC